MNFELWKLGYWLTGTVGIAGTVALIVFVPSVAAVIGNAIARFFGFVFGYRAGCAIVAAVLAAFVADWHRHSLDDAKYAADVTEYEKAQDARDKRIAQETREDVWKEIANATAENAATDTSVKDFTDALPPAPATGNPFRIGDDADRLCHIAGETHCGPVGGERVPPVKPGRRGSQK